MYGRGSARHLISAHCNLGLRRSITIKRAV